MAACARREGALCEPVTDALRCAIPNPQTLSRKKVTDKYVFPRVLDVSAFLPATDEAAAAAGVARDGGGLYDLVAILVHKGNAATSGHYGASRRLRVRAGVCVRTRRLD